QGDAGGSRCFAWRISPLGSIVPTARIRVPGVTETVTPPRSARSTVTNFSRVRTRTDDNFDTVIRFLSHSQDPVQRETDHHESREDAADHLYGSPPLPSCRKTGASGVANASSCYTRRRRLGAGGGNGSGFEGIPSDRAGSESHRRNRADLGPVLRTRRAA